MYSTSSYPVFFQFRSRFRPLDSELRAAGSAAPALLALILLLGGGPAQGFGQTAFVDFTTPGQYTNSFNPWNDVGGANLGAFAFVQSATAGVGGSGGVSVFQSTDTTATYTNQSWDFSTKGAAMTISVMVKANGQTSGDKVQLGIINSTDNGLNDNGTVAFESFRIIPASPTGFSLREQYRSGGVLTENQLGTINTTVGNWYKFVVTFTNVSGASGAYDAACAFYDYGTDGLTPGADIVSFSTSVSHTGQTDVTAPRMWPAFRAFQDAGIDAWDSFLVYTPASPPVITIPLTNATVAAGQSATFRVLAEGPGPISYLWLTNGVLISGATANSYTTPALAASSTNIAVVAKNANGAATNSAAINVFVPSLAAIANLPATGIETTAATLKGQVLSTGGDVPKVNLFYGPTDGGANAGAWSNSLSLGLQSGAFSQTISGLNSNTTYFFAAEASNSAGSAWAQPSGTFTTLATNPPAPPSVAVLTQHNDDARDGANLQETLLNTSNVNTNQFGLLYTRPVDDQVYAQPLIMTNASILGKGVHNLVIVATVNDSVYAFDADDPRVTAPYWQVSFLGPNIRAPRNSDMTGACGGNYKDFSGNLGIVGTPVIDPASGTIYLVARTLENGSTFVQRLHALDVATGLDRVPPVVITATYAGDGAGSVGGVLTFDPQRQNQRPGLALANGVVYIAWASHCDWGPYHGWVIGYDASTLQRMVVYNDTPNGYNGGIWMSGQAPAIDSQGNLYLSTGNGSVDTASSLDRGESFLKLTPNGGRLAVASWFTPYNWPVLEAGDVDLGSDGLMLIPGTSLVFGGGKQGMMYLVNRDKMGGLSGGSSDTNIVQSFRVTNNQIHGGAVWWNGAGGPYAYVWPAAAALQQYRFDASSDKFALPAFAQGPSVAPNGQPGGILALSADGSKPGSGIVWASHQMSGDANQSVRPGILRAYDAGNVAHELWNSEQLSARDAVGNFAKFVPPTVANGKVYLATFSGRLDVYGLLAPAGPVRVTVQWQGKQVRLSWPAGTLQSAGQVTGPYTNITTATSPYTLSPTNAAQFFRVKSP